MEVFLAILLLVLGMAILIIGTNLFVKSVVWISEVTGAPKVVMGATVVAFATSAPEFFISLFATIGGYDGLAVGNVVGSITVNLGIGFALIAILAPHCIKGDKMFGVNGLIMLGVTVGLFIAALSGAISVVAGIILLIVFAVFTFIQIKYSKDKTEDAAEKPKQLRKTNGKEIALNVAFFVLGMVGFIFGADIVVTNATSVASMWGVSDYIIGLTIVAIGTSLPEFTITIIAVLKKENALSIGNLLGTNVFNVAVILPVAALVSGGIAVNQTTMFIHLPVAVAVAAIAIVPTLFTKRVQRWQGISLAGIYAGYLLFLISGG